MTLYFKFALKTLSALIVGLGILAGSSTVRAQDATPVPGGLGTCDDMGAVVIDHEVEHAVALYKDTALISGYKLRLSKIVFEPTEKVDGNVDAAIWTYVECGELSLTVTDGTVIVKDASGTETTLTEDDTMVLSAGDAIFVDGEDVSITLENTSTSNAVVTTASLVSSEDEVDHGCDNLPCRGWP